MLSVVLLQPPAKFINEPSGLGVYCLGLAFSLLKVSGSVSTKETRMSVAWNVFMKSIGWAYLGMETGCKNAKKKLSERKAVASVVI